MTETIGHYELLRHLATGGMAEIYIARQSGPGGFDRELAIKRILPHLAKEDRFISMFLDEARIASQLRHPNIVQIYELGEADGEYFIAMEYIEGADLADLLDKAEERQIEFPIALSVRIIADVLAALDYAHEFRENGEPLRIVHRDVSPHNILIGRDGIIKLVDFGIAHAVERHTKTETGLVKGKLSYMSPEQVEQDPVDRRADVFAAGVLLYELLTGETPFGRELAAVNAILNDDPTDPRKLRPDIPEELTPIILRALEKNPEDRFETAQEMLEALEAVLRSFDKYVSPKHVARFCDRLLSDERIEGYDDVSQAIPRRLSRRAADEAGTAVDTPSGLGAENGSQPEPFPDDHEVADPLAETVDSGDVVDIAVENDVREAQEGARSGETGEVAATEEPGRSGVWKWLVPVVIGFAAVASVGLVLGALSVDGGRDVDSTIAPEVEKSAAEGATTIELDAQVLAQNTPDAGDAGFYFDEEELELALIDEYVETLDDDELQMMIDAHFDRDEDEYLWTIRGAELIDQFTGAPERIDPGDPRAPKLLGLEQLDEHVVKAKKRPRRVRRRRKPKRTATASVEKPREEAKEPAAKKSSPPPPKKRSHRKKKKKKDLQIIDKAVPY